MINDSSDSDEDANFCGSEDQFEALFRQLKNSIAPRSPSPPAEAATNSSDNGLDDSPSSSKKAKDDDDAEDKDKIKSEVDVHELSTDGCDSEDSDVENILTEYRDFAKSYKGDPKSGKHSENGTKSSRKGVTTRAAAMAAKATPAAPAVVITLDDDKGAVPAAKSGRPTSAPVPLPWEDIIDDDVIEAVPVEEEKHTIRVRWKGAIHRFRMYETDTMLRLKEMLAETVGGVVANEIQFYKDDNEIPLESWKTIKEVNLEFTTIIEALRKAQAQPSSSSGKGGSASTAVYQEDSPPPDPSMIPLRIQDGSLRKKVTIVYVKKTTPLSNLRELFLARSGLEATHSIDQIKFMFDGEVVDLSETPNSLEFEEDECLDVIIK